MHQNNAATIKRVPLDFDWELGEPWIGYENPWPGPEMCPDCAGYGFNPATLRLFNSFPSWSKRVTKGEIRELLAETSDYSDEDLTALREGRYDDSDETHICLRFALVEIRARRKNIWGVCDRCLGEGDIPNRNPAVQQLYEGIDLYSNWVPMEPPTGEGWQYWERHRPRSPVFPTSTELSDWCSAHITDPISPKEDWLKWATEKNDAVLRNRFAEVKQQLKLPSDAIRIFMRPPPPGTH